MHCDGDRSQMDEAMQCLGDFAVGARAEIDQLGGGLANAGRHILPGR